MSAIVCIGGIKGGVGKTTLNINVVEGLRRRGFRVILVDTDNQRQSALWTTNRRMSKKFDTWDCRYIDSKDLDKKLLHLKEQYDIVIVDMGGHETPEFEVGAKVFDYLIMPINSSDNEVVSLTNNARRIGDATRKEGSKKIECYILHNQKKTDKQVRIVNDAFIESKEEFDSLSIMNTRIPHRELFTKLLKKGLTVFEFQQKVNADAVKAIDSLVEEIIEITGARASKNG